MRKALAVLWSAGSLIGCAHVQATQSWPELAKRASIGNPVAVTTADQVDVRGKLSEVSPDSVTIIVDRAPRRFDAKDVRQIRRDGDPLWNGFAIGAGIGVLGAVLPDSRCTGRPAVCNDRQIPQRVAFLGAAMAAGIGLDALHRDRTVLYQAPARVTIRLVPTLSPDRQGLSIAVSSR